MTRLVRAVPLLSVVFLLAAGCANSNGPDKTPLGEPVDLRTGTSAMFDGGLRVTFESVPSDSRCPIDAICVRAGEAIVALTISRNGANAVAREVRSDSIAPETTYGNYAIRVTALQPYPRSGPPILQSDYVATLVVRTR